MPTRRGDARTAGLLLLVAAAISGVLVAARGSGAGPASPAVVAPSSWAGLAGGARPRVSVGQRVLVVLRAPSLADRVAGAGGIASDVQERAWTRQAQATQKVLTARLALQ